MAKNWKPSEAVTEIKAKNRSAIADIGRRFPLFVEAVASNDLEAILSAMPDYMTVRKIEAAMKENVPDFVDDEETETETEAAPAKAKRTRRPAKKVEEEEVEEDEEEEEEVKPAPRKRTRKTAAKKTVAKKVEEEDEEDDDEDWDI
jgi:hypothetical protein